MKMRWAALAMTLLASTSWTSSARACSCAVPSAAAARDAALIAFEGELLRIAPAADGAAMVQAVFRLSRVWKGRPSRELTVMVPAQPTMCPPHLEVGQRYILYATGPAGEPRVRSCSRYAAAAGLEAERRALGAPIRTFR